MTNPIKYRVLAPLNDFDCHIDTLPSNGFLSIKKYSATPDLGDLKEELSKSELDDINSIKHWLTFEYQEEGVLNQSNIIILFLLGLWLEIPTKTHVKLIFKYSINSDSEFKSLIRCLDHFHWIEGQATDDINIANLESALRNVRLIFPIVKKQKRLRDALVFTASGCMSFRWQIAFISFSAAVETILTYKDGPGITKRLAKSCSCLTEKTKRNRNYEYRRFIKLYGIRSDIIHGRIHRIKNTKRLELLTNFSNLLRKLWICILIDKSVLKELEKKDSNRGIFFKKIEAGYTPPHVKIKRT